MDPITREDAHSALYFGETRDHWWNLDYLELVARRWGLREVGDVLDVGCGVGHWSRLLARALGPQARLVGVEREQRWVQEAQRRSEAQKERFRYVEGDALALPFADASFDLVTCQTVLIHLEKPEAAVAEMARVLRPGGHLLLVEPNNAATCLMLMMSSPEDEPDVVLRELRMLLTCHRGKRALGLGYDSIGEWLPGLLDRAQFEQIDAAQGDRPAPLWPPYDSPEQRASVDELRELAARAIWCWPQEEARRYYEAGGGQEFEREWAFALGRDAHRLALIERGALAKVGGQPLYLLHARRRAA